MNLKPILEKCISDSGLTLIHRVADTADEMNIRAYLVGGIVRDVLLERSITDFDVVIEGNAIAFTKVLVKKFGGRLTSHDRFFTATWHLDQKKSIFLATEEQPAKPILPLSPAFIDVISARSEIYTQSASLPNVTLGRLTDDLMRRDFTINAMAVQINRLEFGNVIDPCGGLKDLTERKIRTLHAQSFVDDPTRIFRAVRFEKRLDFEIEELTLVQLEKSLDALQRVSGTRLQNEIEHILDEDNCETMLQRLDSLGVLAAIHPSLAWDSDLRDDLQNIQRFPKPLLSEAQKFVGKTPIRLSLAYAIWFMRFSAGNTKAISERLQFPSATQKAIRSAEMLKTEITLSNSLSDSELTFFLEKYELPAIIALACLTKDKDIKERLMRYLIRLRTIRPIATGDTLHKLGIPQGPMYSSILQKLRAAWLDGSINSEKEEMDLLSAILNKNYPIN